MNLQSVGFKPIDPNEQVRRAQEAVKKLKEVLTKARQAFDQKRMRELDTELMNAWLVHVEIEDRVNSLNLPGTQLDQ